MIKKKTTAKQHNNKSGELRSYLYSGGFHRLEGNSTAPGSLAKTENRLLKKICLAVAEIIFLAVGLWYVFF